MPSNSIPHYLYKRNHTWWFRKRFVSEGNAIEYRLSLQTASFQRARLLALRLETLCQQMVASLGGPKNKKSGMMNKTTTELISAKLRAKVAEWTAEETERWFCKPTRDEGDLNDFLETLDMVVSDLKERITYDDKPSLHQAEANTVLNELPHLNAMLSDYDYQVIARMVAEAKVKSLQDTRAIILGKSADWLSAPTIQKAQTDDVEVHLLSEMIEKYQAENEEKEHVEKTQGKYAHSLALTISFFGDVPVSKITVSDGRAFRELLTTLPDGLTTKEMLKTPLHQLISDKKFVKTIGTTTANDHLMKVRRFFQWMLDTGYLPNDNPIPKEQLPRPKTLNKEARPSFSDEDAFKVFNHGLFTSHQGIHGKKKIQHPHHFWLPLLCLFTGIRPNEACLLYVDDIDLVKSVWCIRIDCRFPEQRLKTPNALRYIPLHKCLIDLGFVSFVEDIKAFTGGNGRLFPEIKAIKGYHSHKPGEWFNRNLRNKLELTTASTLYTFRHAFRDKLVMLNATDEYLNRLMGHKGSPYGSSLLSDVSLMKELIDKIEFSKIVQNVKPYTDLQIFRSLSVEDE
ncbi:site-specific integrase [Klebsiella quasipneumoniae]|uniref:site-specific integrase n=3 Tax=Enterobacteriaceae TaxID=543 RepID=UPI0006662451|nr:site-specific integrase [Klebsiella quasipneumoniae]